MRLTVKRLQELFVINTEVGKFVWKKPPYNHPQLAGVEAGTPTPDKPRGKKYWIIQIDGRPYRRGRLVFFVANGKWPKPCLDHIDGNSLDDRASNLRAVTFAQNAWNRKKRAGRFRLPVGIHMEASGRYRARIDCNKKTIGLGTYDTKAEAHAIYLAKRKELFGEFA